MHHRKRHHRKRRLARLAVGLGAVALLLALSGLFFAPWRYSHNHQFDRRSASAQYDSPWSREDVGPRGEFSPRDEFGPRSELRPGGEDFEREWHRGAHGYDRHGPWHYGHSKFSGPRGFGLGPVLLGGLLIALGIWLFRRGNRDDGSQDPPPPPDSEQPSVV